MTSAPSPPPDNPFPNELEDALVDAFLRSPAKRDERIAALLDAHPHQAGALRRRIAEMRTAQTMVVSGSRNPAGDATDCIGPYQILEELGRGGMGTVYLAAQSEPVQRRVALKVIKLGMDSREILARFELERQALAVMDHPAIARVFDAGISATGQPYFVMEYVPGVSLTEFCDSRRLSIDARIAVFQQVCHGVQHAHRKGILHRDLKPGNILVAEHDGRPAVKIIDFGLARATDERMAADSIQTSQGQLLGTPEYMSPEQAGGDVARIDTRTDVYSLGVILYELLCGELPVSATDLRTASVAEIQRRIVENEPQRPSTRVSSRSSEAGAAARCASRISLQRRLRGDLDWIVMRTLAREPERRYESPVELAFDLDRFLANQPVSAGPPSSMYRLQKFVRRNRGRVIAAGSLLLALIAGVIGTTIGLYRATEREAEAKMQQARAEQALDSVHEISRWFIVDLHDQIEDVPGTMDARRQMVAKGLAYLRGIAGQRETDAALALDIAKGFLRIGSIQGWPGRANLGDRNGALRSLREALAAIAGLGDAVADTRIEIHQVAADVHLAGGDITAAEKSIEAARQGLGSIANAETLGRRQIEVDCRHGMILQAKGEPEAALAKFRTAEQAVGETSSERLSQRSDAHVRMVGQLCRCLGSVYGNEFAGSATWKPERALGYLERALAAFGILATRNPRSAIVQRVPVSIREAIASIQRRTGKLGLAERTLTENAAAVEALVATDPNSEWALRMLAGTLSLLARTERDLDRLDDAVATFGKASAVRAALCKLVPDDPLKITRHATLLEMLAGVHEKRRDVTAVRATYAEAIEVWEAGEKTGKTEVVRPHASLEARHRLIGKLRNLGASVAVLAELRRMDAELQRRLESRDDVELSRMARGTRILMAASLYQLAETDDDDAIAIRRLREALDIWRDAQSAFTAADAADPVAAQLPEMIRNAETLLERRSKS